MKRTLQVIGGALVVGLCFFLIVYFFPSRAFILQTSSMRVAERYAYGGDVLFVFDIDDTILMAPESYAEMTMQELVERYAHMHGNNVSVIDRLLRDTPIKSLPLTLEELSYLVIPRVVIEQKTPSIIQRIAKKYPVISISARWLFYLDLSIQQLKEVGVSLENKNFSHVPYAFAPGMVYRDGVICINGGDKGVALENFLAAASYKPARIVAVDDRLYNIEAMRNAAERLEIPFIGLYYTRVAQAVGHKHSAAQSFLPE